MMPARLLPMLRGARLGLAGAVAQQDSGELARALPRQRIAVAVARNRIGRALPRERLARALPR